MASALKLKGINHWFGDKPVLSDINLDLQQGELMCLLGASGSGKTTILRLASGLESLQSGAVQIYDQIVASNQNQLPPEKRQIGMVFQDYALFPHLNVMDNVTFGLTALPLVERHRRASLLLERLRVGHLQQSYPHMLSGGEMQRVSLARALAPIPRLVLLDEPFSELDPQLRAEVRDDTLHILKEVGASALLVTHDAEEAMFMADRIAVVRNGRIVQVDTPANLYNMPVDSFVASFFGDINSISAIVQNGKIKFALGEINKNGFANGEAVDIVLRAEAVGFSLTNFGGEVVGMGRVVAARLLGRASMVHVSLLDKNGA